MSSPIDRLECFFVKKFGTRGVCLWLLGIPWTLLGIGFILDPQERFSKPGPGGSLDVLDTPPGIYLFASMWLIGGVTAMVAAILRPRICVDDWGFVAITLPPFLWGAGYFWSQVISLFTDGMYGRDNAYFAMIVYWSFALLLAFLARRLPDAPEGPCWGRRK